MILFYVVVSCACALGATLGFLTLRRWGRAPAVMGMVLGAAGGGLLFPFPIHGGVAFLGEVLWEEVVHWAQSHGERLTWTRSRLF